jgi:hypothetical protein
MKSTKSHSERGPVAPSSAQRAALRREVEAGLFGMVVTVLCALFPLFNAVTGPIGPFAGGYFAAKRSNAGPRGRAIIAVMAGTALAATLAIAMAVFAKLAGPAELPYWFPSMGHAFLIVLGTWVYGIVAGRLGAAASFSISEGRFGRFIETYR